MDNWTHQIYNHRTYRLEPVTIEPMARPIQTVEPKTNWAKSSLSTQAVQSRRSLNLTIDLIIYMHFISQLQPAIRGLWQDDNADITLASTHWTGSHVCQNSWHLPGLQQPQQEGRGHLLHAVWQSGPLFRRRGDGLCRLPGSNVRVHEEWRESFRVLLMWVQCTLGKCSCHHVLLIERWRIVSARVTRHLRQSKLFHTKVPAVFPFKTCYFRQRIT